MSRFLSINWKDLTNGLFVAVGGSVLGVLNEAIASGSFDIFAYNWGGILQIAVYSGAAYLIKKFFSEDGKVFGKWG